jgi:hypothetical protein
MSINREESFTLLTDSWPHLVDELDHLRNDWLPDAPPFSVAMGTLGRALAAGASAVDDDGIRRIAGVIETLMTSGTEDVKNGIATGLLEAIVSSSDTEPGALRLLRCLGTESRKYCRAWDEFSGGTTPGI